MGREPEISVVVPSHERPLRLRWLLNALEEQTLGQDRFEIVVVHDSRGDETQQLLDAHPLTVAGALRHRRLDPGTGSAPRQRNIGWRMARAPMIAFTDDDCRPDAGWLHSLLEAASRNPGSIVQGRTTPDPYEKDLMRAPRFRTLEVEPPGLYGQTCNILYPRALLERLGGFDESLGASGEDTDLLLRARAGGADLAAAPEAVVYHAVEAFTLPGMLRVTWKWRDLPCVARRHPEIRTHFPLGRFWRPTHISLPLALAGGLLARRRPLAGLLAAPYLKDALSRRGRRPRARVRALVELPDTAVVQATEIAALVWGSVRHRTFFL